MKIAALGDIHGNYQALITVLDDIESWQPDLVLVLGDIVNRGPRSKDCLDLIRKKSADPAWHVIKGNHEGYVLNFEDPGFSRVGVDYSLRQIIHWTYQSLTTTDLSHINQLPTEIVLDLQGPGTIQGAHASTVGDRIGIYPNTPDNKLAGLIPDTAQLFIVGHTHQPLIRSLGSTLVINTGSVGLPFDGDTRGAYAQIIFQDQTWNANIIRVPYDLEAAVRDFQLTNFIPEGGPIADLVLVELELGWPQLGRFFKKYESAVRNKSISVEDAVYEFLKNPNIENRNLHLPR